MLTIGLIGGMSWHSTESYYRRINEQVAARRGGHSSAKISLQSVDFSEIRDCQIRGDWAGSAQILADAARHCEAGGADLIGLCTNLMHKNFDTLESAVDIPALHIADAVARVAHDAGVTRLGLLGARWVMEETFYADRLARHGIEVVVPDEAGRDLVDRVVFEEITQGRFLETSRAAYVKVIEQLGAAGAESVVLACTEIGLLVPPGSSPLPLIDSATAHADALVEAALLGAGSLSPHP